MLKRSLYKNDPNPDMGIPTVRMVFNKLAGRLGVIPQTAPYLKGPIPLDWLAIAAALPGKTLHVALALRWLDGLGKGAPIRFTRKAHKTFSLDRGTAASALARLETAGLVCVLRQSGRCPVVTILAAPKSGEVVAGGDFGEKTV